MKLHAENTKLQKLKSSWLLYKLPTSVALSSQKLLQRNGKETGQQKNYRLPARNGTFSFITEKRSFDLKVNLLKRLHHRLPFKAKIKCQSANLSYQNDSHIAKHAVNFIPNWWNCVI